MNQSLNLSGMGCSASLISVGIVRNVFKSNKNFLWHKLVSGNDKSMILPNCLFRSGGCAMLLTNKRALKHRASFRFKCLVRTHHGARDESYGCCMQQQDEQGRLGVYLSKNLPKAAQELFEAGGGTKPVINFKTGVDHFCLHLVESLIDGVKLSLGLSEYDIEPRG
ncbi:3-ketoacyl-coa synthase 12 [Quercus suber]|uniref:3-ketoacyl-coa synthase 12 n=1 Tax=Quercus suber TaxID=58331 RepID=A0AAW0JDN9_QUESU